MPGSASPPRIIRFGNHEVDLPAGHLRKRGVKVKLGDAGSLVYCNRDS